jgi:hypothetical protein
VITARRYRLASRPFRLHAAASLRATIERTRRTAIVRLLYPDAVPEHDFTDRPRLAATGSAILSVGGKRATVRIHGGAGTVPVPANEPVALGREGARDDFGNRTRRGP